MRNTLILSLKAAHPDFSALHSLGLLTLLKSQSSSKNDQSSLVSVTKIYAMFTQETQQTMKGNPPEHTVDCALSFMSGYESPLPTSLLALPPPSPK